MSKFSAFLKRKDIVISGKRYGIDALGELPIDPALAALTDAGDIESFQGAWLDGAADKLENK